MKEKKTKLLFCKKYQKYKKQTVKKQNRSAREKKFVYLLICEKTKIIIIFIYTLLLVVFDLYILLFWFFGVQKQENKLKKEKN